MTRRYVGIHKCSKTGPYFDAIYLSIYLYIYIYNILYIEIDINICVCVYIYIYLFIYLFIGKHRHPQPQVEGRRGAGCEAFNKQCSLVLGLGLRV